MTGLGPRILKCLIDAGVGVCDTLGFVCSSDADCGEHFVCGVDDSCRVPETCDLPRCDDESCDAQSSCVEFVCEPIACTNDDDCTPGTSRCVEQGGEERIAITPDGAVASVCFAEGRCVAGACVAE